MSGSEIKDLLATVVDGGYCSGCGACAAVSNRLTMTLDEYGRL